jgi:NAD(P)-dependent dehydrogenase (short-subunit alcohol dehydrogenase family)
MGKRVFIVGGSGLLGTAIARELREHDASIFFTWRSEEAKAASLARELGCRATQCDVRDLASVEGAAAAAEKALGGIDALVYAAGAGRPSVFTKPADAPSTFPSIGDLDSGLWERVFDINTRGAFYGCQAVAPRLKTAGGGNILLLSSLDGIKALPSPAHFAASKSALIGFSEALSKELGPDNICVNVLALALVENESQFGLSKSMKNAYLRHAYQGRFMHPREAAWLAAWLALENTYVTGQSIVLDGGL